VEACCFSVWVPASAPLWSSTDIWSPWNSVIFPIARTYEDYVGLRGLKKFGKDKWRKYVFEVVERLATALEPDDIVLGGGNVKQLRKLPKGCRQGENANAFAGGFRLWMK
jgi:polyphosphate glucokinase